MRSTGKLSSHVRRNLVGYVAVFIALSGTAYAARPMITGADIENGSITDTDINAANKDGTAATPSLRTLGTGARQAMPGNATPSGPPSGSAGGDLTGTYPNPSIAANAVNSGKVSNDSLTGDDIQNDSLTSVDVDESSLGKVGDANTLDSFDSADYGAVMLGRVNGLSSTTGTVATEFGAPSGTSTASATEGPVMTVTPNHALKARDLSVQLTAPPGTSGFRDFFVMVNQGSSVLACSMDITEDRCTGSGVAHIPANSTISIKVFSLDAAAADAQFAFRLTP